MSCTFCSIDGGTPDTAMCTASGRRDAARHCVCFDQVAEKSIVWRRRTARPDSSRMSSSKPSSRSRSASSSTSRRTRRRLITATGSASSFSSWRNLEDDGQRPQSASSRPGVATNRRGASRSKASRCLWWSMPPRITMEGAPSKAATSPTCWASSLVGDSTRARGCSSPAPAQSSRRLLQPAETRASPGAAFAATCSRIGLRAAASPFSHIERSLSRRAMFRPCPLGKDWEKSSARRSIMSGN
mmetsp:Transcript_58457/g.190636  ORF Transcript_58457/g.190636 Transcript_58457/m.190636 type:complete len:243 (-) Transcript_58457:874-1602(-)